MTPEQQRGLDEYLAAMKAYGEADFGQYTPEAIASTYGDLQYDPRMREYEMSALRALEEQGKEGFTARDRAAMAQIEQDVNRQARGRSEAIQQNMQRRGIAGSGADLAARLQSAQSANEIAAMRALEREAQGAERRQAGTMGAAQLAGNIGSRDYAAQAQKAAAQQEINRFNAMNRMQAQQYNIGQRQEAAQRRMQAGTGAGQMRYNVATDAQRERMMREEEDRRRRAGLGGAVLGAAGAGLGAYFGGPAGASAGYGIGSGLGQALGFADGGRVPEYNLGLTMPSVTDTVPAMLTPGEMVLPVDAAQSPDAAAQYVSDYNKAEQDLEKAKSARDIYGYADLAARGLSDYAKSQQRNVYLPKSFQQIGTGPDVYRSEMPEFKPGSIAALGERGVQEAEAGLGRAKDKFGNAVAMEKYKTDKQYDDPASEVSKRANMLVKARLSSLQKEAKAAGDSQTAKILSDVTKQSNLSANEAMKTLDIIKGLDYRSAISALNAIKGTTQLAGTPAPMGKPVSGELATKLSGYNAAKEIVKNISEDWDAKASDYGSGLISNIPFVSNDPKLYEQALDAKTQQIGTLLEGGKLTDADLDKYRRMMPKASDTQAQKENKIRALMQVIEAKQNAEISGLESLGYRVPSQNKTPVSGQSTIIEQEQDL